MRDVSLHLLDRTLHIVSDTHDCDSCPNRKHHRAIDAPPFLQMEIGRAIHGDAALYAQLRDVTMTQGWLFSAHRTIDATVMHHLQWLLDTGRLLVVECVTLRQELPAGPPPAPAPTPETPKPKPRPIKDLKTWIEIHLVDEQDKPVANVGYSVKVPEGVLYEGKTDENGKAKITNIDPGTCDVSFDIHEKEWKGA
jgi:hypothetical protein